MTDTLFRHDARNQRANWTGTTNRASLVLSVFFAKENKRPIKIQSITRGAALYHHLGVKRHGEEGGSSQQELYDAFEPVALLQPQGQRKLPGNSLWIVPSPGWGYNMYIHEAEHLIPDCLDKALFHPTAYFLNQKTREFVRWVVQGNF